MKYNCYRREGRGSKAGLYVGREVGSRFVFGIGSRLSEWGIIAGCGGAPVG